MSLASWLRLLQLSGGNRSGRRSGTSKRQSSSRPTVEVLEDRTLLSVFGFQTPFATGTNSYPVSVAVGDFNRDGTPDLATANYGSGTVSVLLGNGFGGFVSAGNFSIGSTSYNPYSVAVGDFNRDGTPDLATANYGSNNVSLLLGNGNGTFQPAANFAAGTNPISVAVGDFNRDGSPDLAVANVGSNNVSILLGNGFGTFGAPQFPIPVGSRPFSVVVGDFNRNGVPDLAVANQSDSTVSVLLGNGNGTFYAAPYSPIPVGYGPWGMAVGDFDGDPNGNLDLAVANYPNNNVSILRGLGNGTFTAPTNTTVGSNPYSVVAGDFNRDGKLDLIAANNGSGTVSVLLNDGLGNGTFTAPTNFTVGSGPYSVAAGDFNRDGALDLVAANNGSNTVSVLLNELPLTTTVVGSNSSPARLGEMVTFTASVYRDPIAPSNQTGVVVFKDGTTILGTGTLNSVGQATFSTATLAVGYHAITAVYQGDPNFSASTSPVRNLLVNQDASSTALTSTANPLLFGQPVTWTATVSAGAPGSGVPTGTVLFRDGLSILGSATLQGGIATWTTTLSLYTHAITAVYLGDGNFSSSTSPILNQAVNNPTPTLTGLSPGAVPEGSVTFTLTLTGTNFLPSSQVTWWNSTTNVILNLTVVAVTSTQIQATVPASLLTSEGTARVTVFNYGPGGGYSLPLPFTIANAPVVVLGRDLNVFGNKAFTGTVASFTDPNINNTAAEYVAIITWDDGTSDYGTIAGSAGSYTVTGSHTFGTFNNLHSIAVTIRDRQGNATVAIDNLIDPLAAAPAPAPQQAHPPAKRHKPAKRVTPTKRHHHQPRAGKALAQHHHRRHCHVRP